MSSQSAIRDRFRAPRALCSLLCLVACGRALARDAPAGQASSSPAAEANTPRAIRALHVSGQECWAVGDAGLILHSSDAGKSWQPVPSPLAANFESVGSHNRTVYVYGGWGVPGHPQAAGMPAIVRIRRGEKPEAFGAPPQGWLYGGAIGGEGGVAFGQAGPAVAGGIWRTLTGGGLWKPLPVDSQGSLLGSAFRTPFYGYIVGPGLRVISMRNFAEPQAHPPQERFDLALKSAAFLGEEMCWAVGETGTVLASRPTGQPWRQVAVRLPLGTRRLADFEAVAVLPGNRVRIAGGLLGIVLGTDNAGATWQHLAVPGALHDLAVVPGAGGADAGGALLAAGDSGRIWRSQDAGKTWQRVHGSEKADVLFVLAAMDRSAYPAIVAHARAGLNVAVVYATHPPGWTFTPPSQPLRAAAIEAGASSVTVLNDFLSLALADPAAEINDADVLAHWSALLDAPAEPVLTQQLAAAIRSIRPDVLAVGPDGQGPRGPRAENRLVARLAVKAAELAAKPDAVGELAAVGLAPWAVKRVFVAQEAGEQWQPPWETPQPPLRGPGVCLVDTAAFPAGCDTTLEMLAMRAAWLLPWFDLTDRPGRLGTYRCKAETRAMPLMTTGLAGNRLRLQTVSTAQQDLASCASIRLAAARGAIATTMPRLLAAAKEGGEDGPSDLVADRMLLVWLRLLQEGRLVQAQEVFDRFLEHGRRHPLRTRLEVAALSQAYSAECGAQLARQGAAAPKRAAEVQADIRRLGALAAWNTTGAGAALSAKLLTAGGRGPAAVEVLNRLGQEPYEAPWRAYGTFESGVLGGTSPDVPCRLATARFVAQKGKFDGALDDPFWQGQTVPIQLLRDAAGQVPPPALAAGVQIVRTPADYLVFAVRLPDANGRGWDVDLAIDADRDAWTQLVLHWNTAGKRSAVLMTRLSQPAELDKDTFSIGGQRGDDDYTFEVALALAQVAQAANRPGLWRFQVRAIARDPGRITTLYFQPQSDSALLPHRYGLLEIPLGKAP